MQDFCLYNLVIIQNLLSFSWTTKDFKADGRLSIGSSGHKNMYIGLSLGGSALDTKGGIVGGIIELSEINMYCEYLSLRIVIFLYLEESPMGDFINYPTFPILGWGKEAFSFQNLILYLKG